MAEYVRSIEVTLTVDTNKRTITRTIEVESLDEVPDRMRDEVSDLLG